jgi:hypothetical protein
VEVGKGMIERAQHAADTDENELKKVSSRSRTFRLCGQGAAQQLDETLKSALDFYINKSVLTKSSQSFHALRYGGHFQTLLLVLVSKKYQRF